MKTASVFLAVLLAAPLCAEEETGVAQSKDASFIETVLSARVIELNFVWDATSPLLPLNPPYLLTLAATHGATTGMIPGGMAFASDIMYFSGQHGAPTIDALGHVSDNGKLYGGLEASANESPQGLKALGVETYPEEKFVNRGVLLDVARYKGVDMLEAGYEITPEDLQATASAQGVSIESGNSVLIRTGYGQLFTTDKDKYMGFRPGIGEASARWLAERDIFLTGTDTLTYDVAPEAGTVFPAHRILIADNGIYLVENLNLEELAGALAERATHEFVLVVNPPRFRGATAFPINAFAILP